jgi:basic amino acid/polyamine antiporter, APA family
MRESTISGPTKSLTLADGLAFFIGIVIGVGIFRTPSVVASNVDSVLALVSVWVAGGLAMLIGALCYCELAASHPNAGGEYHILRLAYGPRVAVLFAWARGAVIQPGAIAAVAFVFSDYAQQLLPLGAYGPMIWAAGSVALLTILNCVGTRLGSSAQRLLEIATVVTILLIIVIGFTASPAPQTEPLKPSGDMIGLAMILVLLTYGGWNEVAYLSGEMKDLARTMVRTVLIGSAVVTALYVLLNLAFVHVLGMEGLRASRAPGADMMKAVAGSAGAIILALAVCLSSLSTLNGTIFTGARTYYALGRDLSVLGRLGAWHPLRDNPIAAFLLQGFMSIGLVIFGSLSKDGFSAMVDYTAPAFWLFMLLVAVSLFVLRRRFPTLARPFSVPLYPVLPILFVMLCAYLLYSSLVFTSYGALVGVVILALGMPLAFLSERASTD